MWINDKIIYTPKITEIKDGIPESATVKGVSHDGTRLTVTLDNGTDINVSATDCTAA